MRVTIRSWEDMVNDPILSIKNDNIRGPGDIFTGIMRYLCGTTVELNQYKSPAQYHIGEIDGWNICYWMVCNKSQSFNRLYEKLRD